MGNVFTGIVAGVLGLVLFLAVNVVANASLRSWRVDLTEERLYTLSEGSKNITADLDEPIRLYFFYSKEAGSQLPGAADYARRVEDLLEDLTRHSDGNLILEVIDPEPFSEAEDRAMREGITGLPLGADSLYFGLVGTNAVDDREVIPFFGNLGGGRIDFASRERFLEYDISRLIYSLAHPEKKTIGVLSSLPIRGGGGKPALNQGAQPPWKFLEQLEQFFDLVDIQINDQELPEDLDALVVIHPRNLSEALTYAIDQYVLGGGKLVAFVDPHCEADMSTVDPSNPMGQMGADKSSDMNQLFTAWGFEVVPGKVVGDRTSAVQVRNPRSQRGEGVDYVAWMQLTRDSLDGEDPVSSLLDSLFVIAPGSVRALDESSLEVLPLVQTTDQSMEIDVTRFQTFADPAGLLETFVPGMKPLTIAARVSGTAATAFPDGRPEGLGAVEGEESEQAEPAHLATSDGPIHVITIADADMLHEQWWLSESTFLGQTIGFQKTADNCDLLINSIENLTGGEDLISIRARGRFARPFDRVEEIRRNAQERFLAEEMRLETEMQEAERRLADLQKERDPSDPNSMFFLSPEQQAEYDRAQEKRTEARRKLRDVRHNMDKDIESLGLRLELINIFAVPGLVALAAIALGVWRIQRRGS